MNMTLRGAVSTSLLVLLSLAPHAAHVAEAVDKVIQTEHGYRVVSDGPGDAFTLEITGDATQQKLDLAPLFFTVDKMVLQIVASEIKDFLQPRKRKKMDDRAVLTSHRDFESKYLEEVNQTRFNIESSWRTLDNGHDALLWTFKMPADRTKNVTEQIYLTTLAGDRVLVLVTSLTAQTDRDASIQLLLRTASTLKMTGKP
jgi:hypothetical protein